MNEYTKPSRQRFYIHAGLPKTGTSFVQSTMLDNRDYFRKQGIYYPTSGSHPLFNDGGHHLLAVSLIPNRWDEMQLQLDVSDLETAWDRLLEEVTSVRDADFFISSEWFAFDVYERTPIAAIREKLQDYEVFVIFTWRDVVDFVNSAYSQRVRDGYDGSPADYVCLAFPHLNWRETAQRWSNVFGVDRVINLRFEALIGDDFLSTFTKAAFGRAVVPPPASVTARMRNRALTTAATHMLREINASAADIHTKVRVCNQIKDLYDKQPNPAPSFLSADLEVVLRRYCRWPALVVA